MKVARTVRNEGVKLDCHQLKMPLWPRRLVFGSPTKQAYYGATLINFLKEQPETILGHLAAQHARDLDPRQVDCGSNEAAESHAAVSFASRALSPLAAGTFQIAVGPCLRVR